jgi:phosphatidate cytidylyltransferase
MKRIATALVLIPAVTWVVLRGPEWALAATLAIVGAFAFLEYEQLAGQCGAERSGFFGLAAGLALLLAPQPGIVAVVIALGGMLLAIRASDLSRALVSGGAFTLGVIYIFGAWRCALDLHAINPHWLMFAILLSWVGDTAALYVGRAFGRHKLAPRLSPAKTWEGGIASVLAAVAGGAIYAHYLMPSVPLAIVLGFGAAGNIAGQIGDLAESALKRGAGVKDSGSTLPGHGGWLDRIDATLFSVPAVYALLKYTLLAV